MSRIGKQLIKIPAGVKVETAFQNGATEVTVKGGQGELRRLFRPSIAIKVLGDTVTLTPHLPAAEETSALWGTYTAHVKNMVTGVVSGFTKQLIIEGIGYKANVMGQTVTLNVGFSHPITMTAPEGVKISLEKNLLTVSGPSREAVGQFAASVRAAKPPDPYKEKGIRYFNEVVSRKQGKKVVT